MSKTTWERLASDEYQLLTLMLVHLTGLAIWLAGLAFAELAHRIVGPLSWWVYLLFNGAAGVALILLVVAANSGAINGLLDLAEARLKTPDRLQRGFVWCRTKFERVLGLLIIVISVVTAQGLLLPPDGADSEFFKHALLFWVSVYGLIIGLLLLASWIAGRFLGTPNTKAT